MAEGEEDAGPSPSPLATGVEARVLIEPSVTGRHDSHDHRFDLLGGERLASLVQQVNETPRDIAKSHQQ